MIVSYSSSAYGGFVNTKSEVDLKSYIKKFDKVEGNTDSKYVLVLLRNNISHSIHDLILFSNDVSICEDELFKWLNRPIIRDDTNEWVTSYHYYGFIVDLEQNIELGYGDIFEDSGNSWNKFTGVKIE